MIYYGSKIGVKTILNYQSEGISTTIQCAIQERGDKFICDEGYAEKMHSAQKLKAQNKRKTSFRNKDVVPGKGDIPSGNYSPR